jgi:predicted GIY-YIG superfamily endonuclease
MENNVDSVIANQNKYQSKVAGGVYCIKYKGEIVYIGSTNQPVRRMNVHFSTITTKNNIGKINKLHSFLGYDKKDFSWNMLETCDEDNRLEREQYYRKYHKSKENFKRIFGKIETTDKLIERLGLTTNTNRKKWRK